MKKLIFISLFLVSLSLFSQTQYSYWAKFKGLYDDKSLKEPVSAIELIFKSKSLFNDSCKCLNFSYDKSINEVGFSHLMQDNGYTVEKFNKIFYGKKE